MVWMLGQTLFTVCFLGGSFFVIQAAARPNTRNQASVDFQIPGTDLRIVIEKMAKIPSAKAKTSP